MDRKTIKFKTPADGHEVEIWEYLTGGEFEQIQDVFVGDLSADLAGKVEGKMSGKAVRTAQDRTLELSLVSIDGVKDDLLKKVKTFRNKDYQFVIVKVNEMTKDEVSAEKKSEGK